MESEARPQGAVASHRTAGPEAQVACHICGVRALAARNRFNGYMLTRAALDLQRRTVWPLEFAVQMLDMEDDQGDRKHEERRRLRKATPLSHSLSRL
jgi:hypothetical protein